jgi:flagellar basal body P-ring protein FlgI
LDWIISDGKECFYWIFLLCSSNFTVGFTSAIGGKFDLSLGSTDTRSLSEGRYVYDILVSSGSTVYRIASGNVLVVPGISSAP